jgi:hypothetical protein
MDSYYGATTSSILGNTVYNIGPSGQVSSLIGAIYDTESGSVVNNILYATAGVGIMTWHGAQHITISNNTIDGAADGGMYLGSGDSGSSSTSGDYFSVVNNIVTNSKNGIYEGGTTGIHNTYLDNLVFNDGGAPIRLQHGLVASGTVNADPKYLNPAAHDYHLVASSPAIGVGTSFNAPSTDIAGARRPTPGGGYDLGAYQMTKAPVSSVEIFPGKGSLTDAKGNVYTLAADKTAMENGSPIPGGSGTAAMELYNSQVYGQDANTGNWYIWNQSYWTSASAPPVPTPGPTPTPTPTPAPTPTPTATEIFPGKGSFTDAKGNVYTLAPDKTATENGSAIPGGSGTGAMELYNSQVYGQDANTGSWYIWNQSYWTSASPPPAPTATITPALPSLTIAQNQPKATISQSNVTVIASRGDHMVFITGSNDALVLQGGTETISDTGGNNNFLIPAAGNGLDVFTTNPLVSDKLDFRTALQNTGWDGAAATLGDYLRITNTANGASVSISPDGQAAHGVGVALLQGQQNVTLSSLLNHSLV